MVNMRHNVLWRLNLSIFTLLIAVLIGAGYFYLAPSQLKPQPPVVKKQQQLPKSGFALKNDYQNLTFPQLQVPYSLPSLRVPDLRNALKFHGKNARPDARDGALFFSLGASKDIISFPPGVPQFIKQQEGAYVLSPRNLPTDLWFEASAEGPNSARIHVFVKDESGKILNEPKEFSSFTLVEKPAQASQGWQIENFRVDGTLLARQKAKWSGRDLFLEQHGGPEFLNIQGKQRITFGDGDNQYAVYVDKGDVLAWKEGKWQTGVQNTETMPLIRIDKIDERLMGMTLFSPKGDSKLLLNLLKTPDPVNLISPPKDFHFQGARTRLHSMFHINKKREIVGPEDWFLKTPEGWKKIKTAKEVDEFTKGGVKGPLFVFHRVENELGKRWLVGTLYNASRSDSLEIRLPLFIEEVEPQKPQIPLIPKPQEEGRQGGDGGLRSLPHQEAPAALPPQSSTQSAPPQALGDRPSRNSLNRQM